MRQIKLIALYLMVFSSSTNLNAQDKSFYLLDSIITETTSEQDVKLVDSCLTIFHGTQNDSIKVIALSTLVESCWDDNIWPRYNKYMEQYVTKLLNNETNTTSLKSFYKRVKSGAMNNRAYILDEEGKIQKALHIYEQCLAISKELNDTFGLSTVLNNIATIYQVQGDYRKSIDLNKEVITLKSLSKNKAQLGYTLNNIGSAYIDLKQLDSALFYYNEAIKVQLELKEIQGLAFSYHNMAEAQYKLQDYQSALINYHKALSIRKQHNLNDGLAGTTHSLSRMHFTLNNIDSALYYGEQSMNYAQKVNYPTYIRDAGHVLSMVYKSKNKYKKSLEMFELFVQMKDSIQNESNQKATIRQQTKYEFEKQQLLLEQEQKEQARLEQEETERRNNLQYSLIFLGILVMFGSILSLGVIKVSTNVAEGIIFFSFLILFEFVLVLVDPYVETLTGGEPLYKLLLNALLAALIFPLHAFFEKLLKSKIMT